MDASEKYFYCEDCGKFHEYGTDAVVNRKLCFFCEKIKKEKTKIIGNVEMGYAQICKKCRSIHGFEEMEEKTEEISIGEVMNKILGGQDETARILKEFGIDVDIVETGGIFSEVQKDVKKK